MAHNPQHTPGPWRTVADNAASFWIEGSDGFSVCRVRSDINAERDNDATLANARLIAEAPAMLEALRRLTLRVEDYCEHNTLPDLQRDAFESVTKNARAVLARIEGRDA